MTIEISQSTDFKIEELSIVTKKGTIDLTNVYEEINIFESIFNPCISGSILIKDSVGMSNEFLFDGTEIMLMKISKSDDELKIKKLFRIYKQSERRIINQNTETYILHFISEEYIISLQQKVSRYYNTTYSEAAVRIITDFLKVPIEFLRGTFDKSLGVKNILVPNLSPIAALLWMSKKAIDENGVPGFLFFENILGYNFASISSLLDSKASFNINFNPKNLQSSTELTNFLGARHFEVITQYDLITSISNGVYAGKFVGFDPVTRTLVERPISFKDIYNLYKSTNSSPNIGAVNNVLGSSFDQFNSRIVFSNFSYFRKESNFIKENDVESISKEFDSENYAFQRKAIFTNLMTQRVKLVVSGNFGISTGFNVFLNVPKYGLKSEDEDNLDNTLNGNYLIVSVRHIISYQKHETIFEAVTDSSKRNSKGAIYQSTTQQQLRESEYV
jgi:hypothetical protein